MKNRVWIPAWVSCASCEGQIPIVMSPTIYHWRQERDDKLCLEITDSEIETHRYEVETDCHDYFLPLKPKIEKLQGGTVTDIYCVVCGQEGE